jgi:tetratricopeptide (TPR) repeat protein
MVCRLLKALESGHLPDSEETLDVDGILYLSPKGLRQINLAHMFADLCKLLPRKQAELLEITYKNPQATVAAKMQVLLNAFPRGRTVVLLDNFEDVVDNKTGQLLDQELNDALHALLEAPQHGIKVLITTRVPPKQLQLTQPGRQTLRELGEGLKSPYAENILREMDADGKLGLRDAPDELLSLARKRTLGYPRALEALQAILAVDRSTTLEEVLLEAENVLPENVVEALVGEAFSRLEPQAQQVMQALATLVAPVPETAVDYLLQPFVPDINSAPILRRLVNMFFARRDGGHFHLHQVDRSYALERVPKGTPSDREMVPLPFTRYALLHRAAEYFEQTRTPRENWKSIDDLAPQLAEFEARVAGGEYDTATSLLLDIDFDYLMLWGHARLVVQLYERLKGMVTDQELVMYSAIDLGSCYHDLGDYPHAIDSYEQALTIAQEIGDLDNEPPSLVGIGNCYHGLDDYPRAIDYYEQALTIALEIGSRVDEGNALIGLGNCYLGLCDYPSAIDYYEQALTITLEFEDRQGEGIALGNLGSCYSSLGNYTHAINYYEQSLAIAHKIGDRMGEGIALSNLGYCYSNLGDYAHAIDKQEQSLAIAREIGDRQGESTSLSNLGSCYDNLGDYTHAIDNQEQSLAIAREIGGRKSEGTALIGLGNCHNSLGDYKLAIDYFEQALAIAREIGERGGKSSALTGIGYCHNSLGDYKLAIDYFEQALAIAREIGERGGESTALIGLGNCHNSLGDYKLAIDYFEQALAIALDIGKRHYQCIARYNLGDSYTLIGQLAKACTYYQDTISIADETEHKQSQHMTHFSHALALLLAEELIDAYHEIEMSRKHDYPTSNAAMWTLMGIIQLRRGEPAEARNAFSKGLEEANGLLQKSDQNFSALDTRALALCGLTLCEGTHHLDKAAESFNAARRITKAKGIVTSVLNQFDALAQADTDGVLVTLRKAAAGD